MKALSGKILGMMAAFFLLAAVTGDGSAAERGMKTSSNFGAVSAANNPLLRKTNYLVRPTFVDKMKTRKA